MTTVRDVMTREVLTVGPATPLKEVAAILGANRISGLPVVQDGVVLGVISEADLLAKEAATSNGHGGYRASIPVRGRQLAAKRDAATAGQAMTSPAVTTVPPCSIGEAARVMVAHHINRLPVVENGRLVGLVTRADLVRLFARPDDQLAEAVRQDVLLDSLWLDPSGFKVSVTEGVVTIEGGVDRRATADALVDLIRRTPGVVGVAPQLHWGDHDQGARPDAGYPVSRFTAR